MFLLLVPSVVLRIGQIILQRRSQSTARPLVWFVAIRLRLMRLMNVVAAVAGAGQKTRFAAMQDLDHMGVRVGLHLVRSGGLVVNFGSIRGRCMT